MSEILERIRQRRNELAPQGGALSNDDFESPVRNSVISEGKSVIDDIVNAKPADRQAQQSISESIAARRAQLKSDAISAAMRDRATAAKAGTLQPSEEALQATERANVLGSPVPPTGSLSEIQTQIQSQLEAHEKRGATAAAFLNKAGEALTFGVVGDEAAGAFDEMIGRGPRDERTQFYRDQESQLEEEYPGLALAADIAPALIPGAGAANAVAKIGSYTGRTIAGGLAGATAGGTIGFMEGEGDDRLANAARTAGAGVLFGAAAPKVTDFAASIPKTVKNLFVVAAKRPTIGALGASRSAAYKAVDEAGEVFDGDTMSGLAVSVRNAFDADNYVEETDSALKATLALLDRRAGQDTTLTQLDSIRKNLWKRYASAKDQPQILDAISAIDDVINTRGGASELMGVARAAHAKFAKSQMLDDAFTKATDQTASTGSGGNILNKYRQAVTGILNNERKAKFFSEGEISMMREFVRGDNTENIKRLVGKMSPSGNGLMMSLHVIGGVASNGASLPLMAIGAAAKGSADKSAMRGADAIQDYLAGVVREVPVKSTGAALAAGSAPVSERIQNGLGRRLNLGQESRR